MSDPGYAYDDFLSQTEADFLFMYLMDEHGGFPWLKLENVPRWECWMNDFQRPYTYGSGRGIRTYEAVKWDREIRLIRDSLRMRTGIHFEGCFLNRYNGQHDALGWHADDDPGINHSRPIAVVSLGAHRALHVRSNEKDWTKAFMLAPGSVLLMPAGSQFTHQHKIPKTDRPVGPRISLTFRALLHIQ